MQSRAARLILLFLFLAAITTAAFLFWKGNTEAESAAVRARAFAASAASIERGIHDLRTAQLGYAAAGQPGDRSIGRVAHALETLQRDLKALRTESTVADAQTGLDAAAAALNEFARSDKRAAEYVRTEQRLLASDVVFGDGLERSDAALAALDKARQAELGARESAVAVLRNRQAFALTAGAAAAILVVLLLVPRAQTQTVAAPVQVARSAEAPHAQLHLRDIGASHAEQHDGAASRPRAEAPAPEPVAVVSAADEIAASTPIETLPAEPVVSTIAAPPAESTDFAGIASLCIDLARVVDTRALPSLLDRTAKLLDASGIILWIADPDGRELNPIFAQGYPQNLVNRLGTIPRDAENATAAAFRTSLLQTVMADEISAGAIAAPLVTPGGCVGVMAAEVRHDSERHNSTLAAATIVAAQLATLVGPPSARPQARTAAN
jgi:hypothetical protein